MSIAFDKVISRSWALMVRVCFKPFDIGKWFTLGFCAWLANLGSGGTNIQIPDFDKFGGGSGPGPGPSPGSGGTGWQHDEPVEQGPMDQAWQWMQANLSTVILLGTLLVLLIIGLTVLLMWLRSRGTFMFLDGLVKNRGAVKEPWRQFKEVGNKLLIFKLLLTAVGFTVGAVIVGLGAGASWSDIMAQQWSVISIVTIIIGGLLLGLWVLALAILSGVIDDFVVPIMYLRGCGVGEGWGVFRHEILAGHVGSVVVFYLVKFGMGLCVATLAVMATCLTCCIAAFPYIGTVMLLPTFVFMRGLSLEMLAQLREEMRLIPTPEELALATNTPNLPPPTPLN